MNDLIAGILEAFRLIITLDPEVIEITTLSIEVSIIATMIAILIGVPIANYIHFNEFKGKQTAITIIQTLYSFPTVLVGLLVFLIISRSGPLGQFHLMFTPQAIIIGETVLSLPIIAGLTISSLNSIPKEVHDLVTSLGATKRQKNFKIMEEAKFAILSGITLGFGRAISEVGAAMMLGGNIRGHTRLITTAMSLETQKGNSDFSIALGIILLAVALILNFILHRFQVKE